ncbi:hypothetical protein [Paraburkholderia sp.]|uniref:hypothetical protein n=1 Tax=Paraburkholderia sp. TaxID=1926495 RepID=UPI0025DDC6AB|nr:hypothetical protein [Paraburkholderia sp.]
MDQTFSSKEGDHIMNSVLKAGRQAAKRHPVHLAGLVVIVGVALASLHALQTQTTERGAAGRAGASYERAWAAVAASGDAGRFVASNYRTCIEADANPATTDGWISIVHSPEDTAAQCGLNTVSLAAAKGDAFVVQVKNVIRSLPVQLAVHDQPVRTLRWFVPDYGSM